MSVSKNIASALNTIETEKAGLEALMGAVDGDMKDAFEQACDLILNTEGRVIVTAVGKSGHVSGKLAATLASTGTPAFFVHATEANHGDLGMIARNDVVIALSWSGETSELKGILDYTSRFSIPLIAITRNSKSALGREAKICLELPNVKEACPNGLAPTTSSIMLMAIGDALAVALLQARGFSADDFGIYHPGGSLGANLNRVSDVMHQGDALPLVREHTKMSEAILKLSEKRFGCVGVIDDKGILTGIVTDGDLARNLDKDLQSMTVNDLMTRNPVTISGEALVSSAMAILNDKRIAALIVLDDTKRPVGIIHFHDLLRLGAA